ncbi:MAG: STAS domain-containing protein [Chitinispirillales bacterium]|jgi:anti-anti-sigma factor|nr:STAS domain-containing protein [Chitinispirillales bacterium]
MKIVKSQDGTKVFFALDGRLDTVTAPELQNVLIPAFDDAKSVTLDFVGVAYVSSAGLRVLLLGEKTAKSKNCSMILINVSQEIKDIFEMTGFSDILKIA